MAFDYDRDGPKKKVKLSGPYLTPRPRIVVENLLAGATREWVGVEHDMSHELIKTYLTKARIEGYDLNYGLGSNLSRYERAQCKKIRNALIKNWDVSIHELKTICRSQNESSLSSIRSITRAELRKEFPGRFPEKKVLVSRAVCREALINNWDLSNAELSNITGYKNDNIFKKALGKVRSNLQKEFPGRFTGVKKYISRGICREALINNWDLSNAELAKVTGYPHNNAFIVCIREVRLRLQSEFPDKFNINQNRNKAKSCREALLNDWTLSNIELAKVTGFQHNTAFGDVARKARKKLRQQYPDRFK